MDEVVADRMSKQLVGTPVGEWMLEKCLGNGKSAVVFRARKGDQVAALKVFDPDLVKRYGEPTQLERINRERHLIGKEHPNLVRIFDGGKCTRTGRLFVAMDYIDALDLEKALPEIPQDRIRPLIAQLASAAKFLEEMGLVHRDIKPANIAVSSDYQTLTLLDLGVIRPVGDGTLTDNERQHFVGTHQYSPPEFMNRKEEDSTTGWRAVTFYQIGGVLHDLLTRRQLFQESLTPQAVLIHAVESETPQINGEGLDRTLVLVARNCLVKDPSTRLQVVTWDDFASAPPPVSVASMREQARRTLAMTHALPAKEDPITTAAKVRLHELVGAVQNMIRKEVFENGELFPAVEVHEHPDRPDGAAEFQAGFPKSVACGLPNALALTFHFSLLDPNAEIVQIAVGGTIAGRVRQMLGAAPAKVGTVFRNAFEETAVRTCVQTILYEALRAAAGAQAIGMDEVRTLNLELQALPE